MTSFVGAMSAVGLADASFQTGALPADQSVRFRWSSDLRVGPERGATATAFFLATWMVSDGRVGNGIRHHNLVAQRACDIAASPQIPIVPLMDMEVTVHSRDDLPGRDDVLPTRVSDVRQLVRRTVVRSAAGLAVPVQARDGS